MDRRETGLSVHSWVLKTPGKHFKLWWLKMPKGSEPTPTVSCALYLGKFLSVGTWQDRWNTLGHLSQHNSSPPFWHTAHQSSLGSSSFLPSPTWPAPIHAPLPLDGWSPVLSGASVLKTVSSEERLQLLFNSSEVSKFLEKPVCGEKEKKQKQSLAKL